MSQVLMLASEFIEHMSNPAYGILENEDYAMRFSSLLASEGFEDMLSKEVLKLKDPESLSPHGWFWLLNWARSKNIRLDDKLLLDLSESLSSVFMQVVIIDVATRRWSDWHPREEVTPLEKFDHSWLNMLIRKSTKIRREEFIEPPYKELPEIDTRRSEIVLVALMQVGSAITIDAARTLLNHEWEGQRQLVEFFWSLCNELDEETRREWISHLQPSG
jgi:hypothetical protein